MESVLAQDFPCSLKDVRSHPHRTSSSGPLGCPHSEEQELHLGRGCSWPSLCGSYLGAEEGVWHAEVRQPCCRFGRGLVSSTDPGTS